MRRPGHSDYVRQSAVLCFLGIDEQFSGFWWGEIRTSLGVVYTGNIVHATCDEENTVGRPGKIVDFRSYGSTHGLDSPCFFVLEAFFKVGVRGLILSRNPE